MNDLTPEESERQLELIARIESAKARSGEAHARAAEAAERQQSTEARERAELRRAEKLRADRDLLLDGQLQRRERHYHIAHALLEGKDS